MMNYCLYISNKLAPYRSMGFERLYNGTELIGHAKFIAPLAYLHSLFAPLNEDDILFMETRLGIDLPESLRRFYLCMNGLKMFNTAFNIYGLRKSLGRTIEASRQPFDIFSPNVDDRPAYAGRSILFIGGYSWNGSEIYTDTTTGKVYFCSEDSIDPLLEWSSFDDMLQSEIERLISMHAADGRNTPLRPTVPIGGEEELEALIQLAQSSERPPYWFEETIKHWKK